MALTSQSQPVAQPLKGWAAFEQRVAESAEYLLILTFVVIFWMAGFVDLFTHASEPRDVLGLYSWPFFILLVVYTAGFVLWGMFLFHPKGLERFKRTIALIQDRAWLGIPIFVIFAGLIISMYRFGESWIRFPLLEIATLMLIVLFTGVILFTSPIAGRRMRLWRKAAIALLAVIAGIEILLQAAALIRISPIENLNGLFTPYGRIYYPAEGGNSGRTNANGWYYPDFRLKEGSERYVLVGGSYLLGLQVAATQNMGVVLDQRVNTDKDHPREVMSMGTPDYGLQVYLHERMFPLTAGAVQPEEVIVVFHVLNDFQAFESPNGIIPFTQMTADGIVDVPEDEYALRHDLWHIVIRGYDPPNPVQTVQSHLFLANVLGDTLSKARGRLAYVPKGYSNSDHVSEEQPFAGLEYLFTQNSTDTRTEAALQLTTSQFTSWRAKVEEAGAKMRLVILPYFPADFYAAGDDWSSDFAAYDLFAPERGLQSWADEQGIPVLPMGQYMQASGLSVADIRGLFFRDGLGHFNAQGHEAVAEAIYGCFYAGQPAADSAWAAVGCAGE